MNVLVNAKAIEMRARVIRADGTIEDLGLVGAYYRNPIRRAWFRLTRWFSKRAKSWRLS